MLPSSAGREQNKSMNYDALKERLDHFFRVIPSSNRVALRVGESKEVFGTYWALLPPDAQTAVWERVRQGLKEVSDLLAEEMKVLPTKDLKQWTRSKEEGRPQLSQEFLDRVPTAYDLIKVAQEHLPNKHWTHSLPASLFARVCRALCLAARDTKEARDVENSLTGKFGWSKYSGQKQVEILDWLYAQLAGISQVRQQAERMGKKRVSIAHLNPNLVDLESEFPLASSSAGGPTEDIEWGDTAKLFDRFRTIKTYGAFVLWPASDAKQLFAPAWNDVLNTNARQAVHERVLETCEFLTSTLWTIKTSQPVTVERPRQIVSS